MDAAPTTPRSLILVRQRSDSGAPSGVDLHVAARPPDTHQDIPLGFVARLQSVLGIHLYITFEQFGPCRPPGSGESWYHESARRSERAATGAREPCGRVAEPR